MSLVNAELTKIAVNTYVTMKISYANALADMCERLPGADVEEVTGALGLDTRIGGKYLRGALAYGGPCFPRDNKAFGVLARDLGAEPLLAEATDAVNSAQTDRLARVVQSRLKAGDAVGILGLAYKPDTDVIDESPGIALATLLANAGYEVRVYDPVATEAGVRALGGLAQGCSSAAELLAQSDVTVIATPWPEFAELPIEALERERKTCCRGRLLAPAPRERPRRRGRSRLARPCARGGEPGMRTGQTISRTDPILVAGAGGFIGGWLVRYLQENGYTDLRAIDIKPLDEWHQVLPDVDNRVADLRALETCREAVHGIAHVYNLACDMGGMGFIEANRAACMISVLINTHLLMAARDEGVKRHFYSSSACIYNTDLQKESEVTALREEDAYPALPEDGYGWEKLFSERMCRNFHDDFGIETRVARYHNVYGPHGTYDGGREKAPAAICRKVAEAKLSGDHEIEIWGDGEQTRSFMYIDDCLYGTTRIMESDILDPINLGSAELVTINQLVDIAEEIAGVKLKRRYNLDAPKGVRGRNSDNR